MPCEVAFTLNDIDLQMTMTFEKASVAYKHIVEFYELWNFVDLDLDRMTILLKIDLDIADMLMRTENEFLSSAV